MSSSLSDPLLVIIAAVFLLAGFVKGTIGMGLPTVAMGLLATRMAPAHALAIVIVPAIVTNIWQTFVGPYLRDIMRRLWPLLICTVLGVWAGGGLLTGPYARYGTIVLGILLVIYAILGLSKVRFTVRRENESWVGAIVGVITGVISAATGVQVIPQCPSCRLSAWRRTNSFRPSASSSPRPLWRRLTTSPAPDCSTPRP
jgi:uncharacterized membrane protein YfcA